MFKKVLVPLNPYDFESSIRILPYIARLSSYLGMTVVLASVVDPEAIELPEFQVKESEEMKGRIPPGSEGILMGTTAHTPSIPVPGEEESSEHVRGPQEPYTSQIVENAKFEAKRLLNRVAARLGDEKLQVEFTVSAATETAGEILRLADSSDCDLIAIATHNRSLLGQVVKGSVTNDVMRSSHVPVLAITSEKSDVGPEQRATMSRVLVPLDGTPFSEAVLPYVEHLAQNMQLKVILVRVIGRSHVHPAAGGMVTPTGQDAVNLHSELEEEAKQYLERIAYWLESKGLDAGRKLLHGGTVSESIAAIAQEDSHDIIALASHGRSGLDRLVFGSTAEQLLRATGDPVLVIPSEIAEKSTGTNREWIE